jgi:tetratricopeptide (TPR) repeat protein
MGPDADPSARPAEALTLDGIAQVFARARDWESRSETAFLLGQASYHEGELAAARSYFEQALRDGQNSGVRLSRYLRDRIVLALAILLGHDEHDFGAAIEYLDQLSEDNEDVAASAMLERGYCLMHLGQVREAEEKIRGGLSMARDQGLRWKIASGLHYLALVLRQQGDPGSLEEATRHLAEAAKLLGDNPRLLSQVADSLARVCN